MSEQQTGFEFEAPPPPQERLPQGAMESDPEAESERRKAVAKKAIHDRYPGKLSENIFFVEGESGQNRFAFLRPEDPDEHIEERLLVVKLDDRGREVGIQEMRPVPQSYDDTAAKKPRKWYT